METVGVSIAFLVVLLVVLLSLGRCFVFQKYRYMVGYGWIINPARDLSGYGIIPTVMGCPHCVRPAGTAVATKSVYMEKDMGGWKCKICGTRITLPDFRVESRWMGSIASRSVATQETTIKPMAPGAAH